MSKLTKRKNSFFEIVKNDLLFLQKSLHSIVPSLIGNVIVHCDDEKRLIGNSIGTITIENYSEKLCEISDNSKYTLSLFDGSLICAYYCFDETGDIISFSISFLPNIESDTLFGENVLFYNGEFYLRIDFEPNSFVENTHSMVHMHTTLFKKGIRIPVNRIVLLSDFLYFVLKRIYGCKDLNVLCDCVSKNKDELILENKLTKDESSSAFLYC